MVKNVEVVNAQVQREPDVVPSGLKTGAYRVKMTLRVPYSLPCNSQNDLVSSVASFSIYLYRREYIDSNSSGAGWALVETQNNTLNSLPSGPNYTSPVLTVQGPLAAKLITTSFVIEADPIINYEWAVGVKVNILNSSNDQGLGPFVYFEGEDANYSYDQSTPPNFETPLLLPYKYYTGVVNYDGSTSAIPYTTPDATRGISYQSLTNPIASGAINDGDFIVNLTLSTANPQATPGLNAEILINNNVVEFGKILYVDPINPARLTIQLNEQSFPTARSLSGGTLRLRAINTNPPTIGVLYANTIEGTEIKRFYTDPDFTEKWIPPFANRYYVFQTVKNYAPNKPSKFSDYPYYCALFNGNGEVVEQVTGPNSQTAWKGGTGSNPPISLNYGYNMYYEEPPLL
jgi:hypothetical protein